jgi:hypothetical protein
MIGLKTRYHTHAEALYSIKTGEPAFKRVTGMEFFDYLAAHPDEGEIFNQAMNDMGKVVAAAVAQSYDFSGVGKIIDVGGGHGTLIAAVLQKYPQMTGILFDSPHVAERARESIASAGLAHRCEVVGGDFFKSVPAVRSHSSGIVDRQWVKEAGCCLSSRSYRQGTNSTQESFWTTLCSPLS